MNKKIDLCGKFEIFQLGGGAKIQNLSHQNIHMNYLSLIIVVLFLKSMAHNFQTRIF